MMKIFVSLFVCFFCLEIFSQPTSQNLTDKQNLMITKQVDSVFRTMVIAAENLYYDKLVQSVEDKYNAGFIINGSFFLSFDSLMSTVKKTALGAVKQSITIWEKKITVLNENIVLLTAWGDAKVEVSSGNPFSTKFYWSFVYEKINKSWKVVQSHQSAAR